MASAGTDGSPSAPGLQSPSPNPSGKITNTVPKESSQMSYKGKAVFRYLHELIDFFLGTFGLQEESIRIRALEDAASL